jgi:hypothetical protein
MNALEILNELDAIIVSRLFGPGPWLVDRESADALGRKLMQMGLLERVPGSPESSRSTSLGKELKVDVLEVFMGLWCEWDAIDVLEEYGLIDEPEPIYELLEAGTDPETVIRAPVQKVYFDYYRAAKFPQ